MFEIAEAPKKSEKVLSEEARRRKSKSSGVRDWTGMFS